MLKRKFYEPKKLSTKIIIIAALLLFIRLLANVPVPFIDRTYLQILFADSSAYALLNNFSGGAFTNMTIMALGVTPYISASIILQLLTVTFPKLKDYQQEYNGKHWKIVTVITGVILGILQSIGIAITLGKRGLFTNYNFKTVSIVTLLWVVGAVITILIGEYITKYCIGNGVSIILTANIIAELPSDILHFYQVYISNQPIIKIAIAIIILLSIIAVLVSATVLLTNAEKEIPVVYPKTANSRNKNISSIPIKLNTAGVMPIIFTSTIYSIPLMFLTWSDNKIKNAIIQFCSSGYWYKLNIYGIIGLIVYFTLVIFFAYFYTAMMFNPIEIANRLRKQGAGIPGIRPGMPTAEYLHNKSKRMTGIGAIMLFVLTQIPTIITHFTGITSLSFGGTSVIIIVGVVIETTASIRSEYLMNKYTAKSNKTFFGIDYSKVKAN